MAYQDEVLADVPIAYWRLEEASGNFADSSGNGWTATATGTPTYQQPGIAGAYSALFNGSSQYAQASASIQFSNPDIFSLEAWINTISAADTWDNIHSAAGNGYSLLLTSGTIRLDKAEVGAIVSSTTTVSAGSWHHIVATKNVATVKLYLDSADVTGSITDRTIVNNSNPVGFGAHWASTSPTAGSYFNGYLDELAIYNGALSAARVLAHYQAGAGVGAADNVPRHIRGRGAA